MTSVTTGSPVSARHAARISSPIRVVPWNEYGDVRALYASPRRIVAPAALAARADSRAWSALSTAHGPAITENIPRPTAPGPILTVPGWGWAPLAPCF